MTCRFGIAIIAQELLDAPLVRAGVSLEFHGVVVRIERVRGEGRGTERVLVRVQEGAGVVIVPGAAVRFEG